MPQVIFAWNYVEWGGAQIHLLAIIREAIKTYDVKVVLPRDSNKTLLKFISETGASTAFFDDAVLIGDATGFLQKLKRHWLKVKSEYAMLNALKQQGLDHAALLHVDLAPWQSLYSLIWLSMRLPTFVTIHNSLGRVSVVRKLLWKLKLKIISHFQNFHAFTSNNEARNYFRGLFSKDKFDDIRVTYTSVDPEEIENAISRKKARKEITGEYGIKADGFLVFCVGQFIDRKGRWTFLEAAKKVIESGIDARFVWIANSAPNEDEMRIVAQFGLGENFVLITSDQIGDDHVDLFELLKTADTFALASTREGLPISLLEAMALGVPCISTNINAIPEAIINEETGLLVEPHDSEALAAAIKRLVKDESLRSRLSAAGREKVLREFNDKVVAQIALNAYKEAVIDAR